jgi:hypothetical protein
MRVKKEILATTFTVLTSVFLVVSIVLAVTTIGTHISTDGNLTIGGTLKMTGLTPGSILFSGTGGIVTQNNAQLFWDNTNNRLGVGTATPTEKLTLTGGTFLQTISTNPKIVGSIIDPQVGGGDVQYGVYVSGNYAYVAAPSVDQLTIVDISNPTDPTIVGSIQDTVNLHWAYAVYVSGKYAYVVAYNRLTIVDISNPSSPTVAGSISDDALDYGLYVSGKYAYVVDYSSDSLAIVDISDPSSPTVIGSISDATQLDGAWGVYVSGKYAYVAAYSGRLTIVDISNPASPTIVGSIYDLSNLDGAGSVYVSGRYAYVSSWDAQKLNIIDVSNPASPTIISSIQVTTLYGASSVFVSGKYAYITGYEDDSLVIVDISNPASPVIVASVSDATKLDGPCSVYVSGRYAYVKNYDTEGLAIIDLFGIDAPSAYIGNLQANDITVTENVDIGNNLYVRSGLNVGPRGILTDGSLSVAGNLTIGSGTPITKHLSATAALDFGAIPPNSCSDLTVSVSGASDGDTVSIGIPNALASISGLQFSGFVSATDTVTVRACNVSTATSTDPAAATIRVDVWQH